MATYTDTEALRNKWKVSASQVYPGQLEWAAETTYEYINSCLDGQYAVPFAATYPETIVRISDMLTKTLALKIAKLQGGEKVSKKTMEDGDGNFALEWLEKICKGYMEIPGVSRVSAVRSEHNLDGYMRIYDLDDPADQVPDPDYIDAVQTERRS